MAMPFLLGQADVPTSGGVAGFGLLTIAFLILSGLVIRREPSHEARLVLLGILVAVAGVGYGTMIGVPAATVLASVFLKIGVILVLGGVGLSVLAFLGGGSPATSTLPPKEPRDVV
jgi:hypothetical protein